MLGPTRSPYLHKNESRSPIFRNTDVQHNLTQRAKRQGFQRRCGMP
jgi:hypothetical protein